MRGLALPVLLAASLAAAAPAEAAPAAPLDIREGAMATALAQLARQARVDLLYDRALVRGLTARPVRGRLTGEAALAKLLAGAGVGYRTTPDGAFVLFAIPAPRPAEAGDGAIAELLVVGRRTQNADIRRTENDIQPYRISGRREIEASGRETVDDFLRTRESANTQAGPLALGGGDVRSSINLRGLGETSTLVLVDGRRMPHIPSATGEFSQTDINGIPLGAVERIEVLTTTAGGIYGPGAIGGVVNVVLRRDYRGADLTVYAGASDRGDAGQGRIEGRLGFTPDHGATDVMLFVSHAEASALRTGRRSYAASALRRRFANDPDAFAMDRPSLNGVSVVSLQGDLTLDPEYGGASLGARLSYLPLGFSGTPAEAAALLAANAGGLPLELSADVPGTRGQIATVPSATSAILNARRRIGSSVEVYLDGLYARNRGRWTGPGAGTSFGLAAGDPGNPFAQDISLAFPIDILRGEAADSFEVGRGTAGAIVSLPRGWKASVDYTVAQSRVRAADRNPIAGLTLAVRSGQPGANGEPAVRPFGNWADVVAALPAYVEVGESHLRLREDFREASLRLSGPLWALPGGPLTATLLVEDLRDDVATAGSELFGQTILLPTRGLRVRSGYAELRAPLGAPDAHNILLRGLELQLAVRHDRSRQRGPRDFLVFDPDDVERFSVRDDATTFTLGARVRPAPWLMLRGSLATGERPPTFTDLQSASGRIFRGPADPLRAGRLLGSEGAVSFLVGGSTRVGPAQAESVTVGVVLNPQGRGPRLSLDYSRIVIADEPAPFPLTPAELLADEAKYPDRVIREDLTAADRAQGLTAGRVTSLDTTATNIGRTVVEAVDAQLDWLLPMDRYGDIRLYGALTWQPTFAERESPRAPTIERTDHVDGPLEWRGNAGVEWARGDTSIDLNAQYYGSYRVTYSATSAESNAQAIRFQGSERIPEQIYVDFSLRQRFSVALGAGPPRALEARLSIQNLFDRSPPTDVSSLLGFSEYGDPRRRRFMLSLSAQF